MTGRVRRLVGVLMTTALLVSCLLPGAAASGAVDLPTVDPSFLHRVESLTTPQEIIVRLEGRPLVERVDDAGAPGWLDSPEAQAAQRSIAGEQDTFLASLAARGITYSVDQRVGIVLNGLALTVAGCDVAAVAGTRSVSYVYESQTAHLLDDISNTAMGVDDALWSRTSATGQKLDGTGTTIGIIDTGIDYTHPDLGSKRFPNAKVIGGYDFADKDSDPMDHNGHGTHVAGIAAADGKIQGVAPKAKLYAYKVFADAGGGADDGAIIAALEQSVKDHCTVVNMSLGMSGGTADNPETEAVNNAVKAGVVVVAATGNSGPRNPTTPWPLGAPATSLNAIAVAASNDGPYPVVQVIQPTATGLDNIMGSYADIAPQFAEGSSYTVVDAGFGSTADFAATSVRGKVALVERGPIGSGGIYFRDKVLNAQAAGAAGVIIYNHSPGVLGMTLRVAVGDETKEYVPCIGITQDAGQDLKVLTNQGLIVQFGTRSHLGTLADFSSMGPTEDFHFKPEVAAPGVTVNSTFPGGEYAKLDGTSMASPAVTGAVALVKAAHPDWTPATVKLALMNTADILRNWQNGEDITWTLQGAGRVDVPAAIGAPAVAGVDMSDGQTTVQTGAVLVDDDTIVPATTVNVRNLSGKAVTFTPSFAWTMDERNGVDVKLSPSSMILAAGATAQLSVTTSINLKVVEDGAHEGVITLQSSAGTLHLPYIYWRAGVEVPEQLSGLRTSAETLSAGGSLDVRFNIGYGGIRPAVDVSDEPQGSSFASQVVTTVTSTDGAVLLGTIYRKSLLLVGDHRFTWSGRDVHGNLFLPDGDYLLRTSVIEGNNDSANLQVTEAAHQSVPIHITGMAGIPRLSLDVAGGSMTEGAEVTISLTADTVSAISGVAASVRFEPYYLSIKSVNKGTFLDTGSTFVSHVDAATGAVTISAVSANNLLSGRGSICTLTFTVLHSGTTELWIGQPAATKAGIQAEAAATALPLTLRTAGNAWDIDGNKRVDVADLVFLGRAYGAKAGDKRYDNAADLNGDGVINDADFQLLRLHFGDVIP
ncbi:MAG: S8 family serine peptidase [Candidatus Cryosericum sp.]